MTSKLSAALVCFSLLAFIGCGDSEEEQSAAKTTTSTTSQAPQGGGEGLPSSTYKPPRAPDTSNLPQPQEGSKRAAPGVPTSKGGDNSIQTWGTEASVKEREELTETLQAFLDARANAQWARACSYLASRQKAEFTRLVKTEEEGDAACGEGMGALTRGIPRAAFLREARIDYVLSARTGERGIGFLIYTRRGEDEVFASALEEEGGEWRVVSVGATALS